MLEALAQTVGKYTRAVGKLAVREDRGHRRDGTNTTDASAIAEAFSLTPFCSSVLKPHLDSCLSETRS